MNLAVTMHLRVTLSLTEVGVICSAARGYSRDPTPLH